MNEQENDYNRFEESLTKESDARTYDTLHVGIKDWLGRLVFFFSFIDMFLVFLI